MLVVLSCLYNSYGINLCNLYNCLQQQHCPDGVVSWYYCGYNPRAPVLVTGAPLAPALDLTRCTDMSHCYRLACTTHAGGSSSGTRRPTGDTWALVQYSLVRCRATTMLTGALHTLDIAYSTCMTRSYYRLAVTSIARANACNTASTLELCHAPQRFDSTLPRGYSSHYSRSVYTANKKLAYAC